MPKKENKKVLLFNTDSVDDSYFMSSELNIRKGVHEQTLEFDLDAQNGQGTHFTVYKQGIVDLHKFLTEWLEKNPD
jgi:hypothetical protein